MGKWGFEGTIPHYARDYSWLCAGGTRDRARSAAGKAGVSFPKGILGPQKLPFSGNSNMLLKHILQILSNDMLLLWGKHFIFKSNVSIFTI